MKEGEWGGPRRRGGAHHPYESSWERKEVERGGGQSGTTCSLADKTSQ